MYSIITYLKMLIVNQNELINRIDQLEIRLAYLESQLNEVVQP